MKHLERVEMSYWQHLRHAWGTAFILLVHGLIPFVWEEKASDRLLSSYMDEK